MQLQSKYLTKGQVRAYVVHPHTLIAVKARGEGKSTRYQAIRSLRIAQTVPRSVNVFYGPTFVSLQMRLLPGLLAGWAEFGWLQGRDWVHNEAPPRNWPKPHAYEPMSYKNTISTKTGSIFLLGSNDRPGMVNSLSITGHVGIDEARFLNYQRMRQDLFPAVRGYLGHWPNNPHCKSWTITTDEPFPEDEADWIEDYRGQMKPDQIYVIAAMSLYIESFQARLIRLESDYLNAPIADKAALLKTLTQAQRDYHYDLQQLNRLRAGSVYYDNGSVLGNLHVLGEDYALQNALATDPIAKQVFLTSFLGIKPDEAARKFYAQFRKKHIIEGTFAQSLDALGIGEHAILSIHIAECNPDEPLDLEFDFGDMCTCSVSQLRGNVETWIASFEVLAPADETDLVRLVADFLKHHRNRRVNVYKDPSGNSMSNKRKSNTFAASTLEALRSHGFIPFDQTPEGTSNAPHNSKYILINKLLKEEDASLPKLRIIRTMNENLISSIRLAPRDVKHHADGQKTIFKVKSSERNTPLLFKPGATTDHSDHFDIKIWHKYKHLLPESEPLWFDLS